MAGRSQPVPDCTGLAFFIERMLRPVITLLVPAQYHLPGMGLVAELSTLFFIGRVVNARVVQYLTS